MTLHEPIRSSIFTKLQELIGTDEASALMDALPRYGLDEVVTAPVLQAEVAGLRTEMADLRTDLRTEMADLRTEMSVGFSNLRVEFEPRFVRIEERLEAMPAVITRQLLFWLIPVFLTVIALSFSAARLGA